MIEEKGRIVKTEGHTAWVLTQRKSTCGQCAAQKGCGTNVFSRVLGNKMVEFKAINKIEASVGDEVVLGLHESVLLKSAILMYVVPLASMFLFALIANSLNSSVSDGWVSLFAVLGLVAGFLYVRQFARTHETDERYHPVILRRTALAEQTSLLHLHKI